MTTSMDTGTGGMQQTNSLRTGDVIRYDPPTTWCRDGYAITEQRNDGLFLVDTYWSGGSGTLVRPDSYEVLFNLADYEEKPQHVWETFAPADRERIPCHHGHRTIYLVRKGAVPDLDTQTENAAVRVTEAEDALRSAERRLAQRREELASLRTPAVELKRNDR